MAVQHEIKSQLAKLLATEDLIVEHRKVETACFNVHTRVLTLPMWERASGTVYDLLVGHEVGHALFTPDENWIKYKKIPPQFVNVVEDARIEKLMKRKYPGLAKTFYRGYKELNDEDFFSICDESVADFNLADRANLYFKIGNFLDLSFTEEEMAIIRMIGGCEDFDDVLLAAEVLYKYCKKQQEKPKQEMPPMSNEGNAPGDVDETESGESQETETDSIPTGEQSEDDDIEVQTAEALSENLKDLVREHSSENVYVEIPKVDIDEVIAENEEIHEYLNDYFNRYSDLDFDVFEVPDRSFVEFKRTAQKEVNYLVKEFECKKAADSYARASTARTGVLDTSNLHTYKFNEDLFKKVSVIPDGKNHGLIFILDWSGSMSHVMKDTCKQLFNLLWFCKKVNIPFEVYAFTNEWKARDFDNYGRPKFIEQNECYEREENQLHVCSSFSLMNFFTSKVSGKELERQMLNIWRLAESFSNVYAGNYSWPLRLALSGTPLNESLVCLHQVLPKFQRDNKLQKVQCVVLTDGEACPLQYNVMMSNQWRETEFMTTRRIHSDSTILRDRKMGTTYKIGYRHNDFVDTMLNNLKDNFPYVNFIGIRVLVPRDARSFMRLYGDNLEYTRQWSKNRSFCIKNSGYDAYFALSSNALAQDSDFDVKDDATKAQIKSAFVKSLRVKKLNKKVLGEFISLVV